MKKDKIKIVTIGGIYGEIVKLKEEIRNSWGTS